MINLVKMFVCVTISIASFISYAEIGDLKLKDMNGGVEMTITKREFNSFPKRTICTKTPWTEVGKTVCFEGVSVSYILNKKSLNGTTLHMHALNDYEVNIPMSDVSEFNVILANKMDGKPLEVKDFGPYFIMYPIDQYETELNKPIILSRSIWQVDSIVVER